MKTDDDITKLIHKSDQSHRKIPEKAPFRLSSDR